MAERRDSAFSKPSPFSPLGHLTAARKLSINEIATYAPADCPLDCP